MEKAEAECSPGLARHHLFGGCCDLLFAFVVFRDQLQYVFLLLVGVTVTMFIPAAERLLKTWFIPASEPPPTHCGSDPKPARRLTRTNRHRSNIRPTDIQTALSILRCSCSGLRAVPRRIALL